MVRLHCLMAPGDEPRDRGDKLQDRDDEPQDRDGEPAGTSLAMRLAQRLVEEKGWRSEVPEEAAGLLNECDVLLSYSDGYSFGIACIVDAEDDPDRSFSLSTEELVDIGNACLKFTGTVNRAKMPVFIKVIEVRKRRSVVVDKRLARLHRTLPGRAKVKIQCFALNRESDTVTSPSVFNGFLAGRRFLERVMREPAGTVPIAAPPFVVEDRFPWATVGLIAAFLLVFLGEFLLAVRPFSGLLAPHVETLVALGGLTWPLFQEGEYWRMLSAAFLHGDAFHIVLNSVALFMAGAVLEGPLGRAWFVALFGIGAIGGSIASLAVNEPHIVSVGASGAIMALLTIALVLASRLPPGQSRTEIQMGMARVLIPALIPLATTRTGSEIDFAAHFGGALVGLAAGFLLLRSATSSPRSIRPGLARGLAVGTGLCVVLSVAFVASAYDSHSMGRHLIPDDEIADAADDELMRQLPQLLQDYPRDPRTLYLAAMRDLQQGRVIDAEGQLREALGEKELLRFFPDRKLEFALRLQLAEILTRDGRSQEAHEIAAPVCGNVDDDELREAASALGVCG